MIELCGSLAEAGGHHRPEDEPTERRLASSRPRGLTRIWRMPVAIVNSADDTASTCAN